MQQKLADREKEKREDNLRALAQKARQEHTGVSSSSRRRSRSRSASSYSLDSEDEARDRDRERKERARERERELRMSKMGNEKRVKTLAKEQGRDISEKVALGLAKPTASADSMYDSRLFNQSSGFAAGFNEDQPYDKPLFAAQEALNSIYRPKQQEEDVEDADATLDKLQKNRRFDGFKDAAFAEDREGPVQFEKDRPTVEKGDDPFNIGQMISEVTGKKRFGIQEGGPTAKRARVDSDEE